MLTKLHAVVVSKARRFHENEQGDAIQSIAIGAVGVLLAAVIFQSMSGAVKDTSSKGLLGMVQSFFSSGTAGTSGAAATTTTGTK